MNKELKPCPFCGEKAFAKYCMSKGRWSVACENCHNKTAVYLDRNEAIKAWNRRATR